jgi:hypothetical protein
MTFFNWNVNKVFSDASVVTFLFSSLERYKRSFVIKKTPDYDDKKTS